MFHGYHTADYDKCRELPGGGVMPRGEEDGNYRKRSCFCLYLKSLELQGFKSFPDKTVLTFESGITAIVGPNGSGKSNIADAIRWVLGEQSTRKLRGGKMEDVIFGGTQKRGPVGFAEVSLVIDNADGRLSVDHSEVMVTRRFYRSGESEYYINGASVRLKDIHEMFMDTGLGRDGYSMIGQGRIDEILSVKSSDRREIFEEASGISKFRHRKEESERRLNFTDESLVRINDKIAEIELQVEPLREQSRQAKQYLVLRDELRSLEINVWMANWDALREAAEKTRADFETVSEQTEQAQVSLDRLYGQAEELAEKMHEQDKLSEQVRATLTESEAELAEIEGEIAVAKNTIAHNEESIARIRAELDEGGGREDGLSAQIAARGARIAEIEDKLSRLTQQIGEQSELAAQAAGSAQDTARRIDGLRAQAESAVQEAGEAKSRISSLNASSEELAVRCDKIEKELQSKSTQREEAAAQREEIRQKLEQAAQQKESTDNIIGGYKLRLDTRKQAADAARQKSARLQIDLESARSRIKLLSEMEQGYEGYSGAVKIIMQESRRHTLLHIHGPVSSLLKTEDNFTVAVETALGYAMQNIVVDTEEDGKAAIELLRSRSGGRATFLPLSAMSGRELSEPGLEDEPGVEGIASSLVTFDEKYGGVMRNLLGRCVVIDNMDSAIRVARKYRYRFRIVTLDGQVINAGGSMTGGSVGQSAGILTRKNELKKLSAGLQQLERQLLEAEEKSEQAARAAAQVEYELEVLAGQKREAEDEVLTMQTRQDHAQTLLDALCGEIGALEEERAALRGRMDQNASEAARLGEEAAGKQADAEQYRREIDMLSRGHEDMTEKNTELSDTISALRMEAAGFEAERASAQASIRELEALQADVQGDRQRRLALLAEYEQKNITLQRQVGEMAGRLDLISLACEQKRQQLSQIGENRMQMEARRGQSEKQSQEKNRSLLELERERARLEQKEQKAQLEEKQIIDRLWEHYGMTHSDAQASRMPVENMSAAQKRISQLRGEITALGNPNIGAIEEYKRVSERYDYLSSQRDDVEKAKTELLEIIEQITRQMRDIFAVQFREINENFSQTFLEIFGGGRAELQLEDEDDILNCGIEIKVQPPGKQLKTISLLSGGEKAFVAIALYFAILKVRPTPFCVLDEIEAALDDVNVTRFSAYLRGMSAATQFIIITHRRGTMEEADTLYGITMQEQGISKMLALHLSQIERELGVRPA